MYCRFCGKKVNDTALFCRKCGKPINSDNRNDRNEIKYFDYWTIEGLIGEGSFGKVYKISRNDHGTRYKAAMKVITIPKSQGEIKSVLGSSVDKKSAQVYVEGMVEEIIKEIEIMSQFKGNSNIVSYEDHREIKHKNDIGRDILIRMELLTPLIDHQKNKTMSVNEVLKLGIDICKALELCSKRGVIHRDIKPENIFVSDNGEYKLGDFGIARTIENAMVNLSKKGTYPYMAPEVYKGEKYGATADIYSLGIVLYQYLNNNNIPFLSNERKGFNDVQSAITDRINGKHIPNPQNADDALSKVILKACAYLPEDRYKNAGYFKRELEKFYKIEEESDNTENKNKFNQNNDEICTEGEKLNDLYLTVAADEPYSDFNSKN